MAEYNFCEEIRDKYQVEELNSKTLEYRINGFIYACNMDLANSECVKYVSPNRTQFINKRNDDKYDIHFTRLCDREKGNSFVLLGKYGKLNILFINYFAEDKRKGRINEIPFCVSLGTMYNNLAYQLDMNTISKSRVKLVLKKIKEGEMIPNIINFEVNINDFSKVLKLVKSFVNNPELVFVAYREILNRKNVVFTNRELDVGLVVDEKLDKPTSKTQKILRKLTNND